MNTVPAFLWIIAVLLLAAPVVYIAGRVRQAAAGWLALLATAVAWVPLVSAAQILRQSDTTSYRLGMVTLRFDGLSLLLAAVVLGLTTLVVLYSLRYMAGERNVEKYDATLLIMSAVMVGLGCAADLFNLWVWFETMAIASYLLVAFYSQRKASLEAGVKYLVQSAVGSVLVLMGIALVFGATGALDLAEIQALAPQDPAQRLLLAAGALLVVGFGVKAALVPLHTWLPDAHAQAPSGISALLSAVVIEAGLIAMLRALSGLAATAVSWGQLLMIAGVVNMIAGNLLAMRQSQVKRLLAYSSITHVGYMLVGLGVALTAGSLNGATGSYFHVLSHGMLKGLAFLAAGALLYALHAASRSDAPLLVSDLSGAAGRYPLVALAFSLSLLGLGGIPPLVGFLSKWQILVAGAQTRSLLVLAVVVITAVNSVFSLVYYAPLINRMYRREPSAAVATAVARDVRIPLSMSLPLLLLATAVVIVGLWPALFGWLVQPAGEAFLQLFGM